MDLAEIAQAANRLYSDPSPDFLRAVLTDALAEISPPLTWPQWLESSGTLERLAECMVFTLGGLRPEIDALGYYLCGRDVGAIKLTLDKYAAMCRAFGVPPVMVEVGVGFTLWDLESIPPVGGRWQPPSCALALAVLRSHPEKLPPEFLEVRPDLEGVPYLFFSDMSELDAIDAVCRQAHPAAVIFRVQVGDDGWTYRKVRHE